MRDTDCTMFLNKEFIFFYKNLFGIEPPDYLIEEYIRAHKEIDSLCSSSVSELESVKTIVDNSLNATAIEPWLRKKNPRHIISQKLLLVSYLAECSGEREEYLRNRSTGFRLFLLNGLKGVFGLITGFIAKKYYGLV